MAPSAKSISLLFILALSFLVQIHARESQFFSKVTNVNNDAKETTTVDPNKEEFLTKHEQQPVFIPQTQNGYGLYGHESGQLPPTTTTPTTTTSLTNVKAAPYTTTPTTTTNNNAPFKTVFEDDESLNKYLNSNQNYNYNPNPNPNNNNNNNNNQNNEFYYNNNAYHSSQNGVRDSRLTQRGGYTTLANQNNYNYNNNNNGANSNNNAERQGMSDTRFLENGKYYYDLNLENNYNPNRYENSRGVDSKNWNRHDNNNNNNNRGYYGSNNNENTFEYNNSMEGYQNEEEFQESQDEFVP